MTIVANEAFPTLSQRGKKTTTTKKKKKNKNKNKKENKNKNKNNNNNNNKNNNSNKNTKYDDDSRIPCPDTFQPYSYCIHGFHFPKTSPRNYWR